MKEPGAVAPPEGLERAALHVDDLVVDADRERVLDGPQAVLEGRIADAGRRVVGCSVYEVEALVGIQELHEWRREPLCLAAPQILEIEPPESQVALVKVAVRQQDEIFVFLIALHLEVLVLHSQRELGVPPLPRAADPRSAVAAA